MEPQLKPIPINDPQARWSLSEPATVEVAAPNKVLRNTYWLLALSMLPTIAGAYAGMAMNFAAIYVAHPIAAPLMMFGVMIAALFASRAAQQRGRRWCSVSPSSRRCSRRCCVRRGAACPRPSWPPR
jgi:hypothetical protein